MLFTCNIKTVTNLEDDHDILVKTTTCLGLLLNLEVWFLFLAIYKVKIP